MGLKMGQKEARAYVRMPNYLGAKIEFNNRKSVIDCVVRNLSPGGAKLRVKASADLPDTFCLHMPKRHERRMCEKVWETDSELGVKFVAADPEMPANGRLH